jgi:Glycosyltransferase family 87
MNIQIFRQRNIWQNYGLPGAIALLYIAVLMASFVLSPKGETYSLWDFRAYYEAGQAILANPANLYNDPKLVVNGFVNLPIIAYLFAPLAMLNQRTAEAIFLVLSLVSVGLFGFYMTRLMAINGWKRVVLVLLIITSHPLFNSLRFGNTTHFVLLLLFAGLMAIQAKKQTHAGILLAIAMLIKIPLLFMLFFLLKGYWKAAIAYIFTVFGAVSLSIVVCGVELHKIWLERCILAFAGKSIPAYNVQSISGFLSRMTTTIPLNLPESWVPVATSWEFKITHYLILSLLGGAVVWVYWRSRKSQFKAYEALDFSIFMTLGLVISPVSWTHYYLLLLLPFALYFAGKLIIPPGKLWTGLMLLSLILIQLPPMHRFLFAGSGVGIFISNLIVSHNLVGALILLGVLLGQRYLLCRSDRQFAPS